MSLTIRKANILDARDVAILHIRSWIAAYSGIIPSRAIAEANGRRFSRWQKLLKDVNIDTYVSVYNHEIVGLLCMSKSRDNDTAPDTYEIMALYLLPEFFGKGVAKPLMDFALSHIKDLGYKSVILWALEENTRADKFYKKSGFYPDGTKKEIVIGRPLDEIRYRKDL